MNYEKLITGINNTKCVSKREKVSSNAQNQFINKDFQQCLKCLTSCES